MKRKLSAIFLRQLIFSRLLVLFIAISAGFTMLSILFYRNDQTFHNTANLVSHAHTVIGQTALVSSLAKDLQWEYRNYMLYGDSSELSSYYKICDSLRNSGLQLTKQTLDNPSQQTHIEELQTELDSLFSFTDRFVQAKKTKNFSSNLFIENVRLPEALHNTIDQKISEINAAEIRLLSDREAASNRSTTATRNLFFISVILILLLLTVTLISIYYYFLKQRKAEKDVTDSETRFRLLINSIKDLAIFMTDASGRILNWYEGASQIKGYRKDEVIGKNISIFYTPEAIEKGEPEQNLETARKQGSYETEGWRVRKDGSQFWADILIAAIYDENGNIQGFTKVTRDFSLHKKLETEMERTLQTERELNKMKSNFVSIASHEFRTPLSAILSSATLLEHYQTTETQSMRDKHIQRIKSSVTDLVSILEDFLSLEKIEEGKAMPRKEIFEIKNLIKNVCAKFNNALRQGQVIETFHTGNEHVCMDPVFVDHILTNLISNAVKYSSANTVTAVYTVVDAKTVKLTVKDEGIGISPADQQHLFERFFRASNTGNIKGTGLGLHIVKRYIDLMEGTISFRSEADKGSEFTVTLPLGNDGSMI